MFPLESWGKRAIVAATRPLRSEPNLLRVLSSKDGNMVRFDPPVHAPVTLARGEWVELESSEDFVVEGSEAILVGQYLVGQDYAGTGSAGPMASGNPSLSLVVPDAQYRTSYTFLAPVTYATSYIDVIALAGERPMIDGAALPDTEWRAIGASGFESARVEVSGGAHLMDAPLPFGLLVYGFGTYTSYAYPGGLDLVEIEPASSDPGRARRPAPVPRASNRRQHHAAVAAVASAARARSAPPPPGAPPVGLALVPPAPPLGAAPPAPPVPPDCPVVPMVNVPPSPPPPPPPPPSPPGPV